MVRHRFDADSDMDPNLHLDSDSDPDHMWENQIFFTFSQQYQFLYFFIFLISFICVIIFSILETFRKRIVPHESAVILIGWIRLQVSKIYPQKSQKMCCF